METQQLQYKLSAFEGPLDLLLTLISKNKIDIYDISISELLDQYMEQINMMQENQMDIASEFLTMASRLVYIKSVMRKRLKNSRKNFRDSFLNMPFAVKWRQSWAIFMTLTAFTEMHLLLNLT